MIDSINLTERNAGAEDWSLDAKAIAKSVGPEYLEHVRRSVVTSTSPETGAPKKALSPRSSKLPRLGGRGYRTGELARGLTLQVTGSESQARIKVKVPDSRWFFLASEAGRGVVYLSADGRAQDVLSAAVDKAIADG